MSVNQNKINSISKDIAQNIVDQEITKRPSRASQQTELLASKKQEVESDLYQTIEDLSHDFETATSIIDQAFQSLPEDRRQLFQTEFQKASEKMQSVGFMRKNAKLLVEPTHEESSCLQWELNLSQELMEFIYSVGQALQEGEQYHETRALFRFLLSLNPYISDFWGQLGLALLKLEQVEDARTSFQIAHLFSPTEPLPIYLLALSHAAESNVKSVVSACEEGIKLVNNSEDPQAWTARFRELSEQAKANRLKK